MAEVNGDIKYEEEFIQNRRGIKQFTCRWLPANKEPKALIFMCHGYGVECSIYMKDNGDRLARAGYAVYGIDYEGHGKTDGLKCYIHNFDDLVDDVFEYFKSVSESQKYKNKGRFLLGESMGGAVALLLHRKDPSYWTGAVLVAPMCKIADEMKPHPVVINILQKLSAVIPKWKIVPTKDIVDVAFKSPERRKEIRSNPYCYQGKPRLQTANELLRISMDIEKNLNQVCLPFLVLHGEDDVVTDPSVSKLLYESASSSDKTFKLYTGMWHGLTSGEPPESIALVFADIIDWLDERATTSTSTKDALSEVEQKMKHDELQPSQEQFGK